MVHLEPNQTVQSNWNPIKQTCKIEPKQNNSMITNFEAARRLLNIGDPYAQKDYKNLKSLNDLFFIDHEFVPLLV